VGGINLDHRVVRSGLPLAQGGRRIVAGRSFSDQVAGRTLVTGRRRRMRRRRGRFGTCCSFGFRFVSAIIAFALLFLLLLLFWRLLQLLLAAICGIGLQH